MQGDSHVAAANMVDHAPATVEPSSLPLPSSPPPVRNHIRDSSSAARPRPMSMQRAKRSDSRITDGALSRHSDEDARTAVKVAVRVRPPLQPTDPGFDLIPQRFRQSTCEVPGPTSLSVQSPQGKKLFLFDRVFDEFTTQESVWDYLGESVSSFVQGYNVSVLAYGQSGSGKSYTMGTSGPEDQRNPNVMGIIPRAAEALFDQLGASAGRPTGIQTPKRYSTQVIPTLKSMGGTTGKNWELKATYVEIYNEQLRDLLLPESVPQAERGNVAIREDTKGRIILTGLTQVAINSVGDLLGALNFGSSIRQTDATAINARSSRSHAVFSLNLIQKKADGVSSPSRLDKRMSVPVESLAGADNVVTLDSKLHFVDLAGSERLKNTGATGDRAREGISINAGLASLGKVIAQLSTKTANSHISYRDSKLTRLLQDSLGGNAITYMVACVTPAVFHLSETLNTVTYAYRARAIQSKPEIQQSHDDADKQAAIDRLRAEVSFLRDQIRHADNSDLGKSDRSRGRDADLQSQLLDAQESYTALSNRHTRLIQELGKARGDDASDTPLLKEALGANATERIKRSNSFAEAVEAMVAEYEKTIQSLESSLSHTRSNLSNSESTLLERETRIAFLESVQQQLHARVEKAVDRERSNESYMRDLEVQMEGNTSGEERNTSLINELRKELARVRESESSAEDYISTLEERLVEVEQDQELMQREIDRLEHVVERQRSIGRLDNLLGELDGVRNAERSPTAQAVQPKVNGRRQSYDPFRTQSDEDESSEAGHDDSFEDSLVNDRNGMVNGHNRALTSNGALHAPRTPTSELHSPAQDDFMADKVENLTQELFDLRSEHETHLVDYDTLQQKYQTALETLARLQYDEIDEPQTPTKEGASGETFLSEAGMERHVSDEDKALPQEQPPSSQSVSSELPSREQSNGIDRVEAETNEGSEPLSPDFSAAWPGARSVEGFAARTDATRDVTATKHLPTEQEGSDAELSQTYRALAERHEDTLRQVEELKADLQKARESKPISPGHKTLLRRKSEDILGFGSDRASRSFASLKNIALDNFETVPDTRQTFEQNLHTVMSELAGRSERVHVLEAELANVRKDMESKQTLISGLTRERSSMKGVSGVDFQVVGQMRDQLMQSEQEVRMLHEQHAVKEAELTEQIESLKSSLAKHQGAMSSLSAAHDENHVPGDFPITPAGLGNENRELGAAAIGDGVVPAQDPEAISRLQGELSAWETKHHDAMESMKTTEAKLLKTIADLEASMRQLEGSKAEGAHTGHSEETAAALAAAAAAAAGMEEERSKHNAIVEALQREVEQYKATANDHVSKLQALEQSHSSILQQVDEDSKSRDLTQKELQTHRDLVSNLENQLDAHKSAIAIHQQSLDTLHASHSRELEDLKASHESSEAESKARQSELEEHHSLVIQNLEADLSDAHGQLDTLLQHASAALGRETSPSQLHTHIKGLVDEGQELHGRQLKTANELRSVREELQTAHTHAASLESTVSELKSINEEALLNLEKISEKENKSARLVEELEEQLNSNFDSHRQANHRLSTMQSETVQVRMELERELEDQKLKVTLLEQQVATLKHHSMTSQASVNFNRESLSPEAAAIALARSASQNSVRKSGGPTALATPPPAIPLPPLPNSPPPHSTSHSPSYMHDRAGSPNTTTSPPGSRHASKDVSPLQITHLVEEQEARIRTIEKHLFAEKQLTATLEEALVDLETSANRTKQDMEAWRRKCSALEDELVGLRREKNTSRASLQAVEEEREMRVRAERARQALEQRMMELNAGGKKKKKKNALNCF